MVVPRGSRPEGAKQDYLLVDKAATGIGGGLPYSCAVASFTIDRLCQTGQQAGVRYFIPCSDVIGELQSSSTLNMPKRLLVRCLQSLLRPAHCRSTRRLPTFLWLQTLFTDGLFPNTPRPSPTNNTLSPDEAHPGCSMADAIKLDSPGVRFPLDSIDAWLPRPRMLRSIGLWGEKS